MKHCTTTTTTTITQGAIRTTKLPSQPWCSLDTIEAATTTTTTTHAPGLLLHWCVCVCASPHLPHNHTVLCQLTLCKKTHIAVDVNPTQDTQVKLK